METDRILEEMPINPTEPLPFDADANDRPPPVVLGDTEFQYLGQGLTADEFTDYVRTYAFGSIPPDYIVLHHTAIPSTIHARYPSGGVWDGADAKLNDAKIQQRRKIALDGIKAVYAARPGWDRGPHLFIDDRYIWLFSPMAEEGIHAMWGNRFRDANGNMHYSVGIEVVGYYEHVPWPEPVAQLVGHAVAVLKQRLGSFELRYLYPQGNPGCIVEKGSMRCAHPERLAWGGISSHRDYNKPQCPGAAISEAFYMEVVQSAWDRLNRKAPAPASKQRMAPASSHQTEPTPIQLVPPTPRAIRQISEDSPICAAPSAQPAQAVAYIQGRPHGQYTDQDIANVIVPTYFTICTSVGIDPILALAQMIHETGNLDSFWAARPQRNPAGIGVVGRRQADRPADIASWAFNTQRQQWEVGLSFASWQNDSIPAHVGRLLAYTLPAGSETPAQSELIARALTYRALPQKMRGTAPNLKQLGKAHNPAGNGWASPGTNYGAKIAAIAQQIVGM
jgi:hypothetical protein